MGSAGYLYFTQHYVDEVSRLTKNLTAVIASASESGRGDAPRMPRILYWSETTDSQPFETGIQRVTRRLFDGLIRRGFDVTKLGWDPLRRLVRPPNAMDRNWEATWLLVPEIPMSLLHDDLDPIQLGKAYGLRSAAIVHDLIPIRMAHLYDKSGQVALRRYFSMFSNADLVITTTKLVADHFREYMVDRGMPAPKIVVVPLPGQFGGIPRVMTGPAVRRPTDPLRLLTTATWEPRKNLPRLLRAIKLARERSNCLIEITLVGRRDVYSELNKEIDECIARMPYVKLQGRVDDQLLTEMYSAHHASVYPSCEEGFGLPVLESLWLGRPCVCHCRSAMAEVAPGGGTLMVDMGDETAISDALIRLSEQPELLHRLSNEALARPLRSWSDYAKDIADHLN